MESIRENSIKFITKELLKANKSLDNAEKNNRPETDILNLKKKVEIYSYCLSCLRQEIIDD